MRINKKKVCQIMLQKNLSPTDLEKRGIKRATLSNILNKDKKRTFKLVARLAKALGVPASEFVEVNDDNRR